MLGSRRKIITRTLVPGTRLSFGSPLTRRCLDATRNSDESMPSRPCRRQEVEKDGGRGGEGEKERMYESEFQEKEKEGKENDECKKTREEGVREKGDRE